MNRTRGFTFLEMAVVLVVAGLLITGILRGQGILTNMRAKDAAAIGQDLVTAASYFRERYHYWPGDWPYLANEIPNVTAGGNGNGTIDNAEVANVIVHLSNAGYIKMSANGIRTAYGAVRLVGRANSNVPTLPATIVNVVEYANLPCEIALELDAKIDDGNLATGYARSAAGSCTPAGANDPVPFFVIPLK